MQDFLKTPPVVRNLKIMEAPARKATGYRLSSQKVEDARAKYLQAAADNELALLKASNEQKDQKDKRQYNGRLLSLNEYYDRRAARIKAEAAAEDAILQTKRQGALGVKTPQDADTAEAKLKKAADNNSATPEQYKRLDEAQKVDAAIVQSRQAAESKLRQNAQDEATARHAPALQEFEDTKKLQEASGDKYGAEETAQTRKYKGIFAAITAGKSLPLASSSSPTANRQQLRYVLGSNVGRWINQHHVRRRNASSPSQLHRPASIRADHARRGRGGHHSARRRQGLSRESCRTSHRVARSPNRWKASTGSPAVAYEGDRRIQWN